MRILLTGGTGFIGSHLIRWLRNQHELWILTRTPHHQYCRLGHDLHCIRNLSQIDLNQIDCVINLAGAPIAKRWTKSYKRLLYNSRIDITQQIIDKINHCETPPHTLINASAIGYYGRQGETIIDENCDSPYPEFTHHLCAQWEQKAQQVNQTRTRLCILRFGTVLGAKGGILKKLLPSFYLGLGGAMGKGDQYMSWIHIDDLSHIVLSIIEDDTYSGIYNLTTPHPVTNQDFTVTLAQVLKRPALLRLPQWVVRGLFGEMSDILLHGQKVVPQRLVDHNWYFRFPTIQSALQQIFHKNT